MIEHLNLSSTHFLLNFMDFSTYLFCTSWWSLPASSMAAGDPIDRCFVLRIWQPHGEVGPKTAWGAGSWWVEITKALKLAVVSFSPNVRLTGKFFFSFWCLEICNQLWKQPLELWISLGCLAMSTLGCWEPEPGCSALIYPPGFLDLQIRDSSTVAVVTHPCSTGKWSMKGYEWTFPLLLSESSRCHFIFSQFSTYIYIHIYTYIQYYIYI